jgi:iron complex transport system substrate-binding protein
MNSQPNPRIISLIASSTEIVHALGLGDLMVGRSHECDYPSSVLNLPVCTQPKFKTDGTSLEIDQRVRQIVEQSLSVYSVSPEKLEELNPSHIITQTQCEVCAVSLKDVENATCQIIGSNPKIVSLEPNSLDDIWKDIERVADALAVADRATSLISKLKERMVKIEAKAKGLKPRSLAAVEWIEPIMAAGNWIPELVEMAGGVNLFGEAKKHAPWMSLPDLIEKDPEVIIVMPCGFDIARSLQEIDLLFRTEGAKQLKAARQKKVFVADGNAFFNRPGPRVVESLEILAEILHPDAFHFGHEGKAYVPYLVH